MSSVKVLLGMASVSRCGPELSAQMLDVLPKYDVKDLDTAHIYPGSEAFLGEYGAAQKFTIHTKAPGFVPGCLSKQKVLDAMAKSLKQLKTDSVETYFLHSPDPNTPFEETIEAIQQLYKEGKFKHFGLSNYPPESVQKIYDLCSSKGYVLPTVYQGNYNPVARTIESDLFPVLRKLKICFYVYSPLAGGFLVKSAESLKAGITEGRWKRGNLSGDLYHGLYYKPKMLEALEKWEAAASEAGTTKAALAYRWVMYNSAIKGELHDGLIIGASSVQQLEQTLGSLKEGPVPEKALKQIEEIWELVKDEAPVDNYHK